MLITYFKKDNPQIQTNKYDNRYFKGIQRCTSICFRITLCKSKMNKFHTSNFFKIRKKVTSFCYQELHCILHNQHTVIDNKNGTKDRRGGMRPLVWKYHTEKRRADTECVKVKKNPQIMCTLIYVIFHSFRNTRQDMIETKTSPTADTVTRALRTSETIQSGENESSLNSVTIRFGIPHQCARDTSTNVITQRIFSIRSHSKCPFGLQR